MIKINTIDNYNLDQIELKKPTKFDDFYVSNIDFCIQTPKLNISKISKKLSLLLNEKIIYLLYSFDEKIIQLISENSEHFFEEKLTIDEAEEIYKSSVKYDKNNPKINLNINKKINIYNKQKDTLDLNDLSSDNEVICLIKCKKIIFYKTHCEPYWEVVQIKIKEKEVCKNNYLFIEDPNDNYQEVEDENIENDIKKIKIKN
jgi:hypothetical protein